MNITQDKKKRKFTLSLDGESATISYKIEKKNAFLTYSNVPDSFRGRGIGKFLILKIYEKLIEEGYNPIPICRYLKAVIRNNINSQEISTK